MKAISSLPALTLYLALLYLIVFLFWITALAVGSIIGTYFAINLINKLLCKNKFYCRCVDQSLSKGIYAFSIAETILVLYFNFFKREEYKLVGLKHATLWLILCAIFLSTVFYYINLSIKNGFRIIFYKSKSPNNHQKSKSTVANTIILFLFVCLMSITILICYLMLDSAFDVLIKDNFDFTATILYFFITSAVLFIFVSISLAIIWVLKKPKFEKEIKINQTEAKEKNEQKANDFNDTIDDIKISVEPLEIEPLQVPKFDYSCYIETYSERISSTLKIICYENFWLIENKDLKKFNQIQSKITLSQINTLYSQCLKEWNNIEQGQKLNCHFETISIDDDTKYKAPYSIDIEKNNFLMTTEIGKIDFSNCIETIDALEYALKYGNTLVKKHSNKGEILIKDEYDLSNKNPYLNNHTDNDTLKEKTNLENNAHVVVSYAINPEELKQENKNVLPDDAIAKFESTKPIEINKQEEEITKQIHNIEHKKIIVDNCILPSIEELNKIWQKYVENNSYFIKDTIKDLTSDDIDLILDRYKKGSKYRKLMANYFEYKIDRTEDEVVGKEISLYRLNPNQIKEKFNYEKSLKNGAELVIRDTFWYVSKEIIPSSKTNGQGIYNRHHYYQEIHYKLAIAQAKKMHKFYLNNKSKYKLKGQETLHYDFKDIIYIYDWSKYKCSYSIDISSSGYIMNLETGKIFYNVLIDKNNDAFKGFIRECLNIINYGNSMVKEYGKGSNEKNMNIVENKYSNNSNVSTNSKILNKRVDILDVDDPACAFRINIDVLNEAFGLNRSMYAKAWYPDSKYSWFSATNSKEQFYIWMPKMYNNSSGCTNSISYDETKIYEIIDDPNGIDATETSNADIYGYNYRYGYRLVFIKEDPKSPYRFVGVFKPSRMEHNNHTYERIATKIKLIGNPVTSIEILDK